MSATSDAATDGNGPDWGQPQWVARAWFEPMIVVSAMLFSCYLTRRRNYTIIPPKDQPGEGLLGRRPSTSSDSSFSSRDKDGPEDGWDTPDLYDDRDAFAINFTDSSTSGSLKNASKKRSCCGLAFHTPNSSRYVNHYHSRFLQKFPFLIEMFYWAVTYVFYLSAKATGELIFSNDGVWEIAKQHSLGILHAQQSGPFSFLFPLREVDVQTFFMNGHQDLLTVLNRSYSLVHIPATVSFIGWYYYAAPSFDHFATVRRMMTVTNFTSFLIFTAYPCMPPRLLPKEYGFFDTVRHDSAESVWAQGNFFNQLAAFPSLHFGYAFCVGVTFIYHSGIFRRRLALREMRKSRLAQVLYVTVGVLYPTFVLTIIVATANHYWMDALAASFVVLCAFMGNKILLVFLPLEDILLWVTKLEKPKPTTGMRK